MIWSVRAEERSADNVGECEKICPLWRRWKGIISDSDRSYKQSTHGTTESHADARAGTALAISRIGKRGVRNAARSEDERSLSPSGSEDDTNDLSIKTEGNLVLVPRREGLISAQPQVPPLMLARKPEARSVQAQTAQQMMRMHDEQEARALAETRRYREAKIAEMQQQHLANMIVQLRPQYPPSVSTAQLRDIALDIVQTVRATSDRAILHPVDQNSLYGVQ
ncbi:hypothetical protein CC85DRAFT_173815 [Cutaneotrichosporon oleaginosum]|uniref:Uncharacterized protein n=1 Tax=Cutaneotrichosporon oleaginosum TaxID=879819 RepID=A0A0J0XVQ3_9TREE|nr:uncharacterized protein CC85DRAFT_173815 [Cutaneotrichosporon oleaginosum]KLT45157.1 hypothetical protein CC85DRAFT_173815 [Cutaneotrichosporon oleaginosum]TXT09837.1 hypothetical protein COLE_03771 [Cutaneotrichosporon oleaginosum]